MVLMDRSCGSNPGGKCSFFLRGKEDDSGQFLRKGDCLLLRSTALRLRGSPRAMSNNDMGSEEGLRGSERSRLGGHMDILGLDVTWPPLD